LVGHFEESGIGMDGRKMELDWEMEWKGNGCGCGNVILFVVFKYEFGVLYMM
jgi:hypothetical protein